jgi:hypothetical protein
LGQELGDTAWTLAWDMLKDDRTLHGRGSFGREVLRKGRNDGHRGGGRRDCHRGEGRGADNQ